MNTTLFQQLPEIYQNFLPAIFGKDLHLEVYALFKLQYVSTKHAC